MQKDLISASHFITKFFHGTGFLDLIIFKQILEGEEADWKYAHTDFATYPNNTWIVVHLIDWERLIELNNSKMFNYIY